MKGFLFVSFLLAAFQLPPAEGRRVLVISTNVGFSHLGFTGRLADVLVEAGHEVDFVIPLWNHQVKRNGTRLARVRRHLLANTDDIEREMFKMAAWGDAFEQEMTATDWAGFDRLQAMYCESLLTDYALIRDLREANYEVAMAESFDRCAFALFRHLRIPSTHVMSAIPLDEWTAFANGVPVDLMNTPIMFNNRQFTPLSSTWERLRNVYEYLRWRFHYMPESMRVVDSAIRKIFGADFPNSLELLGSVDYVWLNTNEHVTPARLTTARIKHIGGIAVDKEETLSEETKSLFANVTESVVLVSFGSIVDTRHMKPPVRDALLTAFSHFPGHRFVWKVTKIDNTLREALRDHPNVVAVEWMDQSGILAHPNTRMFLSHGGLNSLNEAAVHGQPMVVVPFFGDQHMNSAAAVGRGIAVAVDRRRLSTERLVAALRRVLHDPAIRAAAADVRRKIRSAPVDSAVLFAKTVEFAAQNAGLRELHLPTTSAWDNAAVWSATVGGLLLFSVVALWTIRTAFALVSLVRSSSLFAAEKAKKVE